MYNNNNYVYENISLLAIRNFKAFLTEHKKTQVENVVFQDIIKAKPIIYIIKLNVCLFVCLAIGRESGESTEK